MDLDAAYNFSGRIGYGNRNCTKVIIVLLYEIMHHNNMIIITCVMKFKDNTSIIMLYEKKYS